VFRADSLQGPITIMQTGWLGQQRGVVLSTFRKLRLQHRAAPTSTTIPVTVVPSRSIVTPALHLKKETGLCLPSRQRSTLSYLDHQSTTARTTTLLFTPTTVKQQHSVGQFHTYCCQRRGKSFCISSLHWNDIFIIYFLVLTGDFIGHQQVNVARTMATVAAPSHVDLVLNVDNINPNVKAMEYAVRG
jgi:hypothetical protein